MTPDEPEIDRLWQKLRSEAEASGYILNPDPEFARGLAEGLLTNEARYGYRACPCRLASGEADADRDIVCPCDYRDADLVEWGSCYCGLYVADGAQTGAQTPRHVPERRPAQTERLARRATEVRASERPPMWRCRVCGYLCARERPPSVCPICKATSDRFEVYA